jgi:hypothetical protein
VAEKLSRRFQVLPLTGHCSVCDLPITGDVDHASIDHAAATGHEVRITDTRLIIIAPAVSHG